ncbi:MAG: hypothetical protein SFH39_08125 [Candidatus Magnetobacterium sp. LHC-1]
MSDDNSVRIKSEPLSALNKEMASIPPPKNEQMKLAYQTYDPKLDELVKATNRQISSSPSDIKSPYYIVEQHPLMHMLYDGKGISEDSITVSYKIPDIVDKIVKDIQTTERQEVYLVLKNYTPQQAEAFAASANIGLKKQDKSNIKIRTVLHPESRLTRDFFETPVGIIEISEEPVKETTGKHDGWFKVIVKFLTRDGRQLRMEFYAKTKLLAVELIQHLKSYIAPDSLWNMDVKKGTQAELAAKMRIALDVDDKLKIYSTDEVHEIQIVIFIIESQKEG